MSANREPPTLADYVVTAISPALIIGVVSSLVIFIAEVLYAGIKFESRLNHTLFYFSAGIVLVARISIQVDGGRAAVYGIILAIVSWIAMLAFVDYPKGTWLANFNWLINLVLIGIVSWCAFKLTWDCTFIDENRASSSRGLLALAGLEKPKTIPGATFVEDLEEEEKKPKSFLQRLKEYRERKTKRPHTPGLTVIWFSLAALPLFGLGQSLIPPSDTARRSYTFWLATVYVGCAMGLLLTTSFLGLRRYLRQRKVQMPKAMTGVWLGVGGAFVVGFLVVAALLPRPLSETPVFTFKRDSTSQRNASKNAQMSKDAGKGEGKGGEKTTAGDGKNTGKKGDPGTGKGDGKKGGGSEKGKDGKGDAKDKKGGDGKKGEDGKKSEDDKSSQSKGEEGQETREEQNKDDPGNNSDTFEKFQNSSLGKITDAIANILKWLVFAAILIVVLALIFRGGLSYLGNFFPWAKRWLDSLSAWWQRLFARTGSTAVATDTGVKKGPCHRPFSSFKNPFTSGLVDQQSPDETVTYSFTALEAWAADREQPRRDQETPIEFASRMTNAFPAFETDANQLAGLVARSVYSDSGLPDTTMKQLEDFWDRIVEVPTRTIPEVPQDMPPTRPPRRPRPSARA